MKDTYIAIIIILVILASVGGTYYVTKENPTTTTTTTSTTTTIAETTTIPTTTTTISETTTTIFTTTTVPETSDVILSIDKESNQIIFTAETSGNVFMPNSSYWNPTGSWGIYRFVNNEWKKIVPSRICNTFCDNICETGPLACATGGPSPICQLASSEENFVWDKRYVDYKDITCDTETYGCAYYKDAESGKYKVKFTYKTNCSEGESFGSGSIIEKEFLI